MRRQVDTDPGARSGFHRRAAGGMTATDRTWLTLGLAAALGLVAGATLFATEAQGRDAARHRPARRPR